ncbi:peptidoglycan DD-metalloendopeptidase family protein [Membranicola marinus]|uniref:Peptidoglycan DD-metalloendopeptidase family protein n=1 Tax=Membranihabitans marinus TaxID=1227546 RepID=A0A953HRY4_9BACT|nr:peptidoglycan DD-metalloendopeptidase family protein [Membranihabitans marinus]MBY5960154.1 peptidoglycan DD-metalloendopeptidase family protein [Membranihabitans marinus]
MKLRFMKSTPGQIMMGVALTSFIVLGIRNSNSSQMSLLPGLAKTETISTLPIPTPEYKYNNINMAFYDAEEGLIKQGAVLSEIFSSLGIGISTLHKLLEAGQDVFEVRSLRAGKKYKLLTEKTSQEPAYFIYEQDAINYYIFDLKDMSGIEKGQNPVDTVHRAFAGLIQSSLWNAFSDYEIESRQIPVLTSKMEDAMAWSVDFHHVQPGDQFKLIYDEYFVEGESVGIGEMKAAYFQTSGKDYYAFKYNNGTYDGYFSADGRPMKKAFLKAPVKFSRISSRYNLNRFHPILKRTKAHLGTDYAAPYNTEILATADGVIERIGRTRGNGNFIKIKHDKTYSTQYLHMNKFASNMKKGVHVKQGEVIGYVGSTGLATGPHVCYRFWKNGKQVDPLRQNLPEPEPMDPAMMPEFNLAKEALQKQLEAIDVEVPAQT